MISIKNATLKLKKFTINPISMDIPKGYIIGVVGPNASGKSTFLKMIMGGYNKMKGTILIDGIDVHKNRREALKNVGFISEENSFFEGYSVIENAEILGELYPDWSFDKFKSLSKKFGIGLTTPVGKLSKGNRIRFQLAFALSCSPKLLILDEPANGLDPVFRVEFYKIMQKVVAENEVTIIIATHLMEELEPIMDYLIKVDNGTYSISRMGD